MSASITAVVFTLWAVVPAQVPQAQEEIPGLIEELAAGTLAERDAAQQRLVELADAAEPALRKAGESMDKVLASRAKTALESIAAAREDRLWAERIKALAKSHAERHFEFRLNGEKIGGGVLKTREEKGTLILEDTLEIDWKGRKIKMNLEQTSSFDRWLNPLAIHSKDGDGKDVKTFKAEIKDGMLKSDVRNFAVSDKVVTSFALFRVVATLPQRKGFRFDFDSLEAEELNYKQGHMLECRGQEEIELDGKPVAAWAWQHSEGGIMNHHYWVRDGLLVRAVIDKRKEWLFTGK